MMKINIIQNPGITSVISQIPVMRLHNRKHIRKRSSVSKYRMHEKKIFYNLKRHTILIYHVFRSVFPKYMWKIKCSFQNILLL